MSTSSPSAWKKGSIILFHKFQFIDSAKAKYAVLMESWDNNRDTIIFFLTTSNTRFKDKKWTVIIPVGTVSGLATESLVDCNNWWELPKDQIQGSKYIGDLPKEIIDQIDKAVTYAMKIPMDIVIRLRGIQLS